MSRLETGVQPPDFTADSTDDTITFSDLVGETDKGVVVYFSPKASTPGCTKEACDFRDSLNFFKGAGYTVVGISADSIPVLDRFAEKESLNFPLVSDPDHEVLEAWGVWGEKKNYGTTSIGIIRSTVVVGSDGLVERAYDNVKATGHVARLRKDLGLDV